MVSQPGNGDAHDGGHGHETVEIEINDQHYRYPSHAATGLQLRELASIPDGYSLYRRSHGDSEPIRDAETVELHNGDHFFSRPPSNVS